MPVDVVSELTIDVPVARTAAFVAHFQGPFPMETTYTWSNVNESQTLMTLRNRGEPAGFSKLMAPFMAPA